MEIKSVSVLLFLVLFNLMKFSHTQEEPNSDLIKGMPNIVLRYETIDTMKHFKVLDWQGTPQPKYVETTAELPQEIKDLVIKLNGKGIIYFDGFENVLNQAVYKFDVENLEPGSLYIKYFIHLNTTATDEQKLEQRKVYAFPALGPEEFNVRFLPMSSDSNGTYYWNEIIIPLDISLSATTAVEVGTVEFIPGDFLLIEKMALVQGQKLTLDQIRLKFSKSEFVPM